MLETMGCIIGCATLLAPRVVLFLVLVFSSYVQSALGSALWGWLGLVFLPFTTLVAAWVGHQGPIQGMRVVFIVIAVLIDLACYAPRPLRRRARG